MLLPRRLWQLAFAQIPQKQYSPHPWIIFPWIKDHQTCYYIVSFFCHLSQPVDTSSISRFPPTSLSVECLCPSATTAGLRELCTQSSAGKHGFRFNTFFVSCFGAKNYEQLSSELVSTGQIQVNVPQALLLPLLERAWRPPRTGRRLKCIARLSSFNWSLSLACFWKTIVWDEALVSFNFTQTWVNSSQKGERTQAGFTETANAGYSKFKSAFTGCLLNLCKMKWRQIPWKI